jgi:hypothetical protein
VPVVTAALDEARMRLVTDSVGANGASTSDVSIFVDTLPEWPGVSIVLMLTQGQKGDAHFGDDVPSIERPRIEMLVRSTAPVKGQTPRSSASKTAAFAAYRSLVSVANESIAASTTATPSVWLNIDAPSGAPHLLDRDAQGRIYWRCLFACDRMST